MNLPIKDISFIEMRFSTSLAILDLIQPITDRISQQLGFDDDTRYWIWLATQEALNNAIRHGNKLDEGKRIHFTISVEHDEFKIVIKDEGEGFDTGEIPDPTAPDNLLRTSGRGLYYMRNFMDRVEFDSQGGTKVTLIKHLNKE